MWKIPETPVLLEQRKEIDADRWSLEGGVAVGMLRKPGQRVLVSWDLISLSPSICEICGRNTLPARFPLAAAVPFEW